MRTNSTILIREANDRDLRSISLLISLAFFDEKNLRDEKVVESLLFEELVKDGDDVVSLVAEESDSEVVGHVFVSPVSLEPDNGLNCGQISPLSVHPKFQFKGIGKSLMRAVIIKSEQKALDALFLLGDPNYYGLFGFLPSKVKSAYGPSDYFQELVLNKDCAELMNVYVRLAPAFTRLGL